MNDEPDLNYVRSKIEEEGFHYTFADYSDFKEIKDEKFHELRKAYLEAVNNMHHYLNS